MDRPPAGDAAVEELRRSLVAAGIEPYEFSLTRKPPVSHRMQHEHVEEFGSCVLTINSRQAVLLLASIMQAKSGS